MQKSKRFLKTVASIFLLLGLLTPWPVAANTASSANNDSVNAVTVGYGTDTALQNGMIVRLKPGDPSKVEPLTMDSVKDMHGVVVAPNDAAVTLSGSTQASRQVYVAQTGRYEVLISTQNGAVHSGDYISISSLSGVGMKALSSQAVVLGKAAADFDGTGSVVSSANLVTTDGKKVSVSLGRIPVDLGINHNPLAGSSSGVPGFLSSAASVVTSKPVSPVRLYSALVVFLAATAITGSLLYGGVRSSLTAIGRNPLAKRTIMRDLLQVIFTSLAIFVAGVGGVYLLLRL